MRITPILSDLSDNYPINTNSTFKFLRGEAEKLSSNSSSDASPIIQKSKLKTLNLLLNEVILTTDPKLQHDLLIKVSSWYTSHSPKTQKSSQSLTPKIHSNNSIFSTPLPKVNPSVSITHSMTPEPNHLKKTHQHNMMQLASIKKLNEKYLNWENVRSKLNSDLMFRRSSRKTFAKKPRIHSELIKAQISMPVVDLRPSQLADSRNLETSQRFRAEQVIIEDVKRKLAHKRLVVSSKCLENGISLYNDKEVMNTTQLLPFGGEMLMKSPKKPAGKLKKVSKKRKRL